MQGSLPRAVNDLAQELMRLPSIGPKSAQRLAIYLLRQPAPIVSKLADTLKNLHANVHICKRCFNLAEQEVCHICQNAMRNSRTVCVVEDPLDIDAIERTNAYDGLYHVLGGVLSPMEGVSVDQLTMEELLNRITSEGIEEVIVALDQNMEGEATTRYLLKHIATDKVRVTRLARGLPTGGDIEFADAMTLSAALSGRKNLSGQ